MLKQIVAAGILLIFMAQTFSNAIIVADYYINTSSFAVNCENKDKPLLHCNGKCQLSKKVESEQQKDQNNPNRKAAHRTEVISSKNFYPEISDITSETHNGYQTPENRGKPQHRANTVFHPPCSC